MIKQLKGTFELHEPVIVDFLKVLKKDNFPNCLCSLTPRLTFIENSLFSDREMDQGV